MQVDESLYAEHDDVDPVASVQVSRAFEFAVETDFMEDTLPIRERNR